MKQFNKTSALRKIKFQKNKNTYIKRLSISLSCLILLFLVILFTFARFDTSSDEYVLINGKIETYPRNICEYNIGKEWTFNYNGNSQEFSVPCNGKYKVELWGAQGGEFNSTYYGGKGGYTSGLISLNASNKMYLYVGGAGYCGLGEGPLVSGGYNGGGDANIDAGTWSGRNFCSGGGATDIRLTNGTWNNYNSLKSRIMVAAGGGGANKFGEGYYACGGHAGGLNGYASSGNLAAGSSGTPGATQTTGYKFGIGDSANTTTNGGGGGYYGALSYTWAGGAGGSSFISGYSGCNAIAESSTESSIVHTNQPNHYSGKIFTNSVMIDGKGCNWSTGSATNCGANQQQPNGTTTTGHIGNGYAKITLLSTTDRIKISLNANGGTLSENYIVRNQNKKIGELPTPTKNGYIFKGWYLEPSLSNVIDVNTIVTSSITNLYAKWEGNQYQITYNYNYNVINNGDFSNGLTNWQSKNNGTLAIDSSIKTPDNRSSVKVCGANIWAGLRNSSVDYKAGKTYTFSFQAYRNTSIVGNFNAGVSVNQNEKHYNPAVNFNNNNEINKWSTLYVNVSLPNEIETFLAYGNYNTNITANQCVWIANFIMTQYDTKTLTCGDSLGTLDSPTRTGYTFQGWYTQASGGTKITSSTTVPAANTTYYAHWN